MSIRFSGLAKGMLVVAAVASMAGYSWAVFHKLPDSKDEWKMKYDVAVKPADGDKVTVEFTVADEGRLKPFYSADVVAFSKQLDSQGGRSYDVKAHVELKKDKDGKLAGQAQIPKNLANRAMIRILTLTVDGKKSSSASYYDIPLEKYVNKAAAAGSPATASTEGTSNPAPSTPAPSRIASPAPSKVTK